MNLIVAVDQNWAIGKDGDQLVYLKEDLKRFRTLTSGHTVILGRKTLTTFPGGRPLKKVFSSVEELVQQADGDAFVIGGASVYEQLLPYCDTAYITKIHAAFPADTYFPDLDKSEEWEGVEESESLEQDGIAYHYVTYRRK